MDSALTAVVVTYNSADVVAGLLDSLDAALAGADWRLIVADNGSRDQTIPILQADGRADIIEMGRNAGYAAGINSALARRRAGEAVLILNPDVRLTPGSGTIMMQALSQPDVGIVVPRLTDEEGRLLHSLRREPTVRRSLGDAVLGARRGDRHPAWAEAVTEDRVYDHPATSDWATGAVMLLGSRCLDACGPWDDSFFLYSEETEYCLRARDEGFRLVYTPAARAVHIGGESKESPALWALLVVNRVRLFSRRRGTLATIAFWCVAVVRESSRIVLGSRVSARALIALFRPSAYRSLAR